VFLRIFHDFFWTVLRRDGFGEEKFFHCMVAVENGNAEGKTQY